MYEIGQRVVIATKPGKTSGHYLKFGSIGVINTINETSIGVIGINDMGYDGTFQVLQPCDFLEYVGKTEVLVEETPIDISKLKPITEMATTSQRNAVLITALEMLQSSTKITPEEVKEKLRKDEKEYRWVQPVVEKLLEELTFKDLIAECKGGYCSKTTPMVGRSTKSIITKAGTAIKTVSKTAKPAFTKTVKISKTTALGLIKNNKGRFFTAVFAKKDGTVRTINCQYRKGQPASEFGYVQVNESGLLKTTPTKAIRQINMQTLKSLTIAGTRYVLNS